METITDMKSALENYLVVTRYRALSVQKNKECGWRNLKKSSCNYRDPSKMLFIPVLWIHYSLLLFQSTAYLWDTWRSWHHQLWLLITSSFTSIKGNAWDHCCLLFSLQSSCEMESASQRGKVIEIKGKKQKTTETPRAYMTSFWSCIYIQVSTISNPKIMLGSCGTWCCWHD